MLKYALKRIAAVLPLFLGLSVVLFLYIHAIPGNPVAASLGAGASPKLVAKLSRQLGLDRPLVTQYWQWLAGIFHGNLGRSLITQQPISETLLNRLPASAELTGAGLLCTLLIGWCGGFLAGLFQDTWIDRLVSGAAALGLSVPQFWLGTVFILVFAVKFRLLPSEGYVSPSANLAENLRDLTLPAFALGLSLSPYLVRMTRVATIEIGQAQFLQHAKAKGLRRRRIVARYMARNAVAPVIIIMGLQFGALLGGQVVIEELFDWPGVGRLLVTGVQQRDYPMIQALILVIAGLYVLLYLSAELVQALLDPRIRLNRG